MKNINNIIERYIYDVTRRLPENECSEVKLELEANINDMLPDDPSEQAITDALTKLGAPRILAEQYREKPRYLISPAMFELYISVLKLVVPIVAGVLAIIGLFASAFSSGSIFEIITAAITSAFGGALQAAVWTTIGFAVADYSGIKPKAWTVNDLPNLPEQKSVKISLSSAIGEMIVSVFFTVLFIYMVTNAQWAVLRVGEAEIIYPFTDAAVARMLPYIIVLGILAVGVCALKLIWGRWNIQLCIANIVSDIISAGIIIYILRWNDLFSGEIGEFAETITGEIDILSNITSNGVVTFFFVMLIIGTAIDIGAAIWNTWKGTHEQPL